MDEKYDAIVLGTGLKVFMGVSQFILTSMDAVFSRALIAPYVFFWPSDPGHRVHHFNHFFASRNASSRECFLFRERKYSTSTETNTMAARVRQLHPSRISLASLDLILPLSTLKSMDDRGTGTWTWSQNFLWLMVRVQSLKLLSTASQLTRSLVPQLQDHWSSFWFTQESLDTLSLSLVKVATCTKVAKFSKYQLMKRRH